MHSSGQNPDDPNVGMVVAWNGRWVGMFYGDPERFGGLGEIKRRLHNLQTLYHNMEGVGQLAKPYLGRSPFEPGGRYHDDSC